jgi:tRNA G18 (ribose-2'-O)-methylase SpoU
MTKIINPSWPVGLETSPLEDRRNVINHYHYWETDAIRADLDLNRQAFAILCENYANDFNIGTIIRNANAFLAKEVVLSGRHRWDKRGAVGTYHYEHLRNVTLSEDVIREYKEQDYRIVAIDNLEGAQSVYDYTWNPKSLIILGQEQIGVSPTALAAADDVVYIPQLGSVRSLNVGVASGIIMSNYSAAMLKA